MPPMNLGVLGTSQNYGFSIPRLPQGTNWPQANEGISTQFDQATLGISSHLAQANARNSTRSGNEDT